MSTLDIYEVISFARKLVCKKFPYLSGLVNSMPLQEEETGGDNFSVWSDAAGVMHFNPKGFDHIPDVQYWSSQRMMRVGDKVVFTLGYTPLRDNAGNPKTHPITVAEMAGVLLHENLHIINRHIARGNDANVQENKLWNIACDLVIHSVFEECEMELLPGCVTFDTLLPEYQRLLYRGKASPEEIYEVIKDCPLDEASCSMCGRQEHTESTSTTEPPEQEPESNSPEEEEPTNDSASSGDEEGQSDQPDLPPPPSLVYTNLEAKIEEALDQMELTIGDLPGVLQRLVKGRPRPAALPWYQILRAKITQALRTVRGKTQRTYKKPSRRGRIDGGLFRPHYTALRQVLLVVIDTSGSVSDESLRKVWEELSAASQVVGGFWLMQCDSSIHSTRWVRPGEPIPDIGEGGGGTSFLPPFEEYVKLNPKPSTLVYFTDGQGFAPLRAPADLAVVWVVDDPLAGVEYPIFPGDRFGEIIKCHS